MSNKLINFVSVQTFNNIKSIGDISNEKSESEQYKRINEELVNMCWGERVSVEKVLSFVKNNEKFVDFNYEEGLPFVGLVCCKCQTQCECNQLFDAILDLDEKISYAPKIKVKVNAIKKAIEEGNNHCFDKLTGYPKIQTSLNGKRYNILHLTLMTVQYARLEMLLKLLELECVQGFMSHRFVSLEIKKYKNSQGSNEMEIVKIISQYSKLIPSLSNSDEKKRKRQQKEEEEEEEEKEKKRQQQEEIEIVIKND